MYRSTFFFSLCFAISSEEKSELNIFAKKCRRQNFDALYSIK